MSTESTSPDVPGGNKAVAHSESDIRGLCHKLVPKWSEYPAENIKAKPLTGGMTNLLWLCELKTDKDNTNQREQSHHSQSSKSSGLFTKVVVRIFGSDTSLLFSRHHEQYVSKVLGELGIAAKILAEFDGGRIEQFFSGRTLICADLSDPAISAQAAACLAKLHATDVDLTPLYGQHASTPLLPCDNQCVTLLPTENMNHPVLFQNIRNWLKLCRAQPLQMLQPQGAEESDEEYQRRQRREHLLQLLDVQNAKWDREIDWLSSFLQPFQSPVVFCHNDMQEGNFIAMDAEEVAKLPNRPSVGERSDTTATASTTAAPAQQDTAKDSSAVQSSDAPCSKSTGVCLEMIDFEYSSYNYRAFDLANHICEHYIDYSLEHYPHFALLYQQFPSPTHIRTFVRNYLTAYHRQRNALLQKEHKHDSSYAATPVSVNEDEVIRLEHETVSFMLASHFMWSLWGILQSYISGLSFGYADYAYERLHEYERLKALLQQVTEQNAAAVVHQATVKHDATITAVTLTPPGFLRV